MIKTLSHFIAEQGIDQIDILKIDVEKAELDILCESPGVTGIAIRPA